MTRVCLTNSHVRPLRSMELHVCQHSIHPATVPVVALISLSSFQHAHTRDVRFARLHVLCGTDCMYIHVYIYTTMYILHVCVCVCVESRAYAEAAPLLLLTAASAPPFASRARKKQNKHTFNPCVCVCVRFRLLASSRVRFQWLKIYADD